MLTFLGAQNFAKWEKLSAKEIVGNNEIKPKEALDILKSRYEIAIDKNQRGLCYELAKRICSALYYNSKTKEIETWQAKVDSLAKFQESISYDRSYSFHLISFALIKKEVHSALEELKKMEPYMIESTDTTWMINWHIKKIEVYNQLEDKANALKHLLLAERLNDSIENEHLVPRLLDVRGAIAGENGEHEKSLQYFLEASKIFEEQDQLNNLPANFNNVIAKARDLKQNELALIYMEKLSKVQKRRGCNTCYFTNELNKIWFHISDEDFAAAIKQSDKVLNFADSTNRDKSHATYLKGVAYRGLDEYDKAETWIQDAFNLAKGIGHSGKCSFYSHALYQTYLWKDKFQSALEWFEIHTSYRDSVYNEKKAKEIAVYESKLETLEEKRKVKALEDKLEIDRHKKNALWITFGFASLLGISIFYAQSQKTQKEKLKQESLLMSSKMETDKLRNKLEFKQKELASHILTMAHKNALLSEINDGIDHITSEENKFLASKLKRTIDRHLNDAKDWDAFINTFQSIHSNFLQKIQDISNNLLTSNELRLASLMKMNLSSKEIANLLNITQDGVKKARYRLRKKLDVSSDVNIQDYLLRI